MFNKLTGSVALVGGMNLDGLTLHVKRIPITATPTGAEQDTGWDLPAGAMVLDVWLNVKTAEATGTTKTLDVGLLSGESGGDADGLLDGIDASSVGLKKPTLASTGQTRGALLRADESGAGALVPESFATDSVTAKSVSYTAGSNDWAEFRGDLYLIYWQTE